MTRPRYSIRWLLFVLLLVGAYLGGFVHARRLYQERLAKMEAESELLRRHVINNMLETAPAPTVDARDVLELAEAAE